MSTPSPLPAAKPTRRAAFSVLTGAGISIAAPAHAQLGDFVKQFTGQQPAPSPPPSIAAGLQTVVPRGYSERFLPVRGLISEGRYSDASSRFTPKSGGASSSPEDKPTPDHNAPIVSDPFLLNAETGLIAFEGGALDQAVNHLHLAEDSQAGASEGGVAGIKNFASDATRLVVGKASGQEELAAYHPLDHEVILQLNYLALSYLLQGERRCYNITRRCIEGQAALKIKFDREIEEYKAKYAQQEGKAKVSVTDRGAIDGLANQFKVYDNEAARVPNAYVNPVADYLAGVIQEIVSHEQPALRDNSRISYLNAAKLCGRSAQLTAAGAAMARARPPAKERVLHVIVGEGFSPAREVMTYGLSLKGQVVPVRVPIFKPVASSIDKIVVQAGTGSVLATLDPVGDVEAIRLRDQHDRIPEIMLGVFTSSIASYFEGQTASRFGMIGQFLHNSRESAAAPDTRSWLSLPRRFHIARLVLPPSVQSVHLISYDTQGRKIGSHAAPVPPSELQSILYARATKDGIQAQAAKRLWIDGRLDEATA